MVLQEEKPKADYLNANLLQAKHVRSALLDGYRQAIIFAALALMVLEALIDPRATASRARGRLAGARYAFLALWIALLFARPDRLSGVSWLLAGALVLVSLLAAFVPITGARRSA